LKLRDQLFKDKNLSNKIKSIDDKDSIEGLVKKLMTDSKSDVENLYRLYIWI
jgi:hypothetical protein